MSTPLRVVYMGTPDFAVPALQALIDSQHDVVGVVTQPDRKSGRGKKVQPTPVKACAQVAEIDVYQPQKLRKNDEAFERISAWEPDVCVVAAYGQILPQRFLDIPRLHCVNIHASLLPKYRGASPINAAIVHGELESGVTTMIMEAGLDTGPMLLKESVSIGPLETAQQLHDRLSELGATMIVPTIEGLQSGTIQPEAQSDEGSTYAPLMSKADGLIDWTKGATQVANQMRGLNPWPGAYSDLTATGQRIKFHLAEAVDGNGQPGEVLQAAKDGLLIACGDGAVNILKIQPPGSRAMAAQDFLNGFDLAVGSRFGG